MRIKGSKMPRSSQNLTKKPESPPLPRQGSYSKFLSMLYTKDGTENGLEGSTSGRLSYGGADVYGRHLRCAAQ